MLISWAMPAASVPIDAMRSAICRRPTIRLRSVMSVQAPTIRVACPAPSRATTRPRPTIHRQSPDPVSARCSTSKVSFGPAAASLISAWKRGMSSGWMKAASSLPVRGVRSSGKP